MFLPFFVLSVTTLAETVTREFINFDYSPILYEDFLESENHPVVLFSFPQNEIPRRHPHQQPAILFLSPSTGHEMQSSSGQDGFRSSERLPASTRPQKPHLFQQAAIQTLTPDQGTATRHQENTFSHYSRNFKENHPPRRHGQRNAKRQRDLFTNPTARHHNSRTQRMNSEANSVYHRGLQKTNTINHAMHLKSNPRERNPVSASEVHSPEIDFLGKGGKVKTLPIIVQPNVRAHEQKKTLILVKPSVLVTTNRPHSAPRGFRTRPQHVEPSTDARYPKKESPSVVTVTVKGSSSIDRDNKQLANELKAQGSHRLEQTDRNLYYKSDPFLDITEVYSLPKDVRGTTRDGNVQYKNDSSAASSKSNRTTTGRMSPNKFPVDKKLDERKRQLQTFRKMKLKKALKEGDDHPTYQEVPPTNFNCRDVRSSGFYADVEAGCQVFHKCDVELRKHSFLCPNGTVFRQELLICDWWYNVRCEDATDFYPQ